jgi:hypothetical protein
MEQRPDTTHYSEALALQDAAACVRSDVTMCKMDKSIIYSSFSRYGHPQELTTVELAESCMKPSCLCRRNQDQEIEAAAATLVSSDLYSPQGSGSEIDSRVPGRLQCQSGSYESGRSLCYSLALQPGVRMCTTLLLEWVRSATGHGPLRRIGERADSKSVRPMSHALTHV